jgi:hypothetical protein
MGAKEKGTSSVPALCWVDGLNQVCLYRQVSIFLIAAQSNSEKYSFCLSFVQQAIFGDEFV